MLEYLECVPAGIYHLLKKYIIYISTIMEQREDSMLRKLKEGTSYFRFVPDDIGDIIYCNSTNDKDAPAFKDEIYHKIVLSILIPSLIVVLDWYFFYTSFVMSSIVSTIMIVVAIVCVDYFKAFQGTDFFVGTLGYAKISFKKKRDKITEKEIYHFNDLSDLVTGETRIYQNDKYLYTDYFFRFWSKDNEGKRKILDEIESNYSKERNGGFVDAPFYRFYKKVETTWNKYKFNELNEVQGKNNLSMNFTLFCKDQYLADYIMFDSNGLTRVH